jgi:hypothetical protein
MQLVSPRASALAGAKPDLTLRNRPHAQTCKKLLERYDGPVYGNCCICGLHSKLSFEHVPPRAAYNDQRVFEANIRGLVAGSWDGQERPMQDQGK